MPHESKPSCPLCEFSAQVYLFSRHGARVIRCGNCGLTRLDGDPEVAAPDPARPADSLTGRKAAERYLAAYEERGGARSGLLVIADDHRPFQAAADAGGIAVAACRTLREIEAGDLPPGPFAGAVILLQLEKAANPLAVLRALHPVLAQDAVLLVVTPSLDSWPARVLRRQWTEWQPGNRTYFDTQTIQSALLRAGFARLEWSPYQLHYLVVTARRVDLPTRPLLSVVMPVFNERATFERTLQAVIEKACEGVDKEIVIVESGSTDGTRELVRKYDGHPGVTVILEERPRGKGAAVRTGLRHARGTLVLIQDADSEYDVNDYDALLEPLLTWRRAFVLGSRHVGSWKMRRFVDEPAAAAFFNAGHVLFRTALNVLYRQSIQDPFTMYKVFRRDCLHGLRFECNRFDFDFELVIKLVRKGYVPLEIPVNYESRSFSEGKKVSAFRDPLTWIRALVKFRFASIYDGDRGGRP